MMPPFPNDPELSPADLELERALSGLRPATAALDTPRAMFEAGRVVGEAAGRNAVRKAATGVVLRWRAAAALLAVVTGISVTANVRMLSREPQMTTAPMPPAVTSPSIALSPSPTAETRSPVAAKVDLWRAPDGQADLLSLRTIALADGIEALPRSTFGSAGKPMRVGDVGP